MAHASISVVSTFNKLPYDIADVSLSAISMLNKLPFDIAHSLSAVST